MRLVPLDAFHSALERFYEVLYAALPLLFVIAFVVFIVASIFMIRAFGSLRKSKDPMIGVSVVPFDSSAINGVFALEVKNYGKRVACNVKCSVVSTIEDKFVYRYGSYDFLKTPFFSESGVPSIAPGQTVVYPFLRSLDNECRPVEGFKEGSVMFDVQWKKNPRCKATKDSVMVDFKDLMWIVESNFTWDQNDKKLMFEQVQILKKISDTMRANNRVI